MVYDKYKLTFFPARGRGEFIRYIFAYAEVPYDEELVAFDDWPSKKHSTPFLSLPILEINNGEIVISQSLAIGRCLAKRFGLAGRNAYEQALVDQYIEGWQDIWPTYMKVARNMMLGDIEATSRAYQEFKEETLRSYLNRYQQFIHKNTSHSGWLVGDKVTWADIVVGEFLDRLHMIYDPELFEDYPDLQRFVHKLNNLPGIKRRIETRPDWKI